MSVTPNILTHTTSALYGNFEWRYYDSTTTHYRYGMWHIGNAAFFQVPSSLIQVGKSGQSDYNTWSDSDTTSHPNSVVDNNSGNVTLDYSGTTYSFVKPTTASWISSGGGTSTEGLEHGSITYSNNVLTWTIDSSSHTATTYKLYRDSTEVMSIGHTSGHVSTGTISNPSGGLWALVYNAQAFASLNVATSGSTTGSTSKKVHSNFW